VWQEEASCVRRRAVAGGELSRRRAEQEAGAGGR